jgi:hypothetical protein
MPQHPVGTWQHIAEQLSNEKNPDKLMELATELNRLLGEHEETSRQRRQPSSSSQNSDV